MADEKQRKPHAIMISLPFQGHISQFVNLTLKIASKGIAITFVHLEFIHHKLSKIHHENKSEVDIFSRARELGLDIRYTTISDGLSLEYDRDVHFLEYWNYLSRNFPARVDEFVGKEIQSNPFSVHFLVIDNLFAWPASIAKKYNIVHVSLWSGPAMVFSLAYHWEVLKEKGHVPCKDMDVVIDYVPGVQSISTRDLMSYLKEADTEAEDLFVAFQEVKKADFIIHNTVHELEPETLSALNKYQPNYAIGPINFFKNLATDTVGKSLRSQSDCTVWLDSKPAGSVLYVSFGSLVQTSVQVIQEIAYGLLLSEVNFLWVVRHGIVNSSDPNILPAGYENEAKDRGLIIPWCNQMKVLSNPAVRGFLTHSGWNSTLESIWCGVPMICYPITYDQFPNKKLVVDNWKMGISLCDGAHVYRKEVAEKIRDFMNNVTTYKRLKQGANEVKEILHNAVEIDGSSEKNFDQFIKDLKNKIHGTCINE